MAGTLSATIAPAAVNEYRNADFTATGELAAQSFIPTLPITAGFTGAGALSATGVANYTRSAALSSSGTLAATSTFKQMSTATLSGSGTLTATVAKPPLAVVGTPVAVLATTVTIPAHQIGDLILIFASGGSSAPSKPAASGTVPAWADIDAPAAANITSYRSAYFVATATNHTSGTWGNSQATGAIVLRNQKSSAPIGAHATASGTAAASPNAPAVTMTKTDGTSLLLHCYTSRSGPTWGTVPAGYTRQVAVNAASNNGICLNSKTVTTSDGAITQPCTLTISAVGYWGNTIEILAP